MRLVVGKDYEECSRIAAAMFEAVIQNKLDAVLGCATGSSPMGLYQCLVKDFQKGEIDLSEIHTINLDEYIGLSRNHNQSFGFYMDQHFFSKVNIKQENN